MRDFEADLNSLRIEYEGLLARCDFLRDEAARLEDAAKRQPAVLDEFRAWMYAEAHDGHGARRWGVQHVLDHYDERTEPALREALTASSDPTHSGGDE